MENNTKNNLYDDNFSITLEAFSKKLGFSHKDRIYLKLLEYKYGIQPATEAKWHMRLEAIKKM